MAARVTVVIPAYNAARFLRPAIDSVLAQTFGDVEIVVVDDGSTDDTLRIAQSYGPPVRSITQSNEGPSVARNTGLRHAAGEFVAFLDSDDVWAPRFLERVVAALDASPDAGYAYAWAQFIDEAGTLLPGYIRSRPGPDIVRQILGSGCLALLSMTVFRAASLRAVAGFNAELRQAEDWDLFLRLASAGIGVVHVPEVLVQKRLHSDSLSADMEHSLRWSERALASVASALARSYQGLVEESVAQSYLDASANLWRQGRRGQAIRLFSHAAVCCPAILERPGTYVRIVARMNPYGWRSVDELSQRLEEVAGLATAFMGAVLDQSALPEALEGRRRVVSAGFLAAVAWLRYKTGQWKRGTTDLLRSVAFSPLMLPRAAALQLLEYVRRTDHVPAAVPGGPRGGHGGTAGAGRRGRPERLGGMRRPCG